MNKLLNGVAISNEDEISLLEDEISELKDTLKTNIYIAAESIDSIKHMEYRLNLNKEVVGTGSVEDSYLALAVESFKFECGTLGKNIDGDIDTMNELVVSSENVINTAWEAVVTILKTIWEALKRLASKISKFFKLKENAIKAKLEKISKLKDISPFNIKDSENLINSLESDLFIFLAAGKDICDTNDMNDYIKAILSNTLSFENSDMFLSDIVSNHQGTINVLGGANKVIDGKILSKFDNYTEGIRTKINDGDVNLNVLTSFGPNTVLVMSTYKDKNNKDGIHLIRCVELTVKVKKGVFKGSKISKLSKNVLETIENGRLDILGSFEDAEKLVKVAEKKVMSELNKLHKSDDNKVKESAIRNISVSLNKVLSTALNHTNSHDVVLDRLSNKLYKIYKDEE